LTSGTSESPQPDSGIPTSSLSHDDVGGALAPARHELTVRNRTLSSTRVLTSENTLRPDARRWKASGESCPADRGASFESSAGYSVRVLARTGLEYTERGRSVWLDSEVLAKPRAIAIYPGSAKVWIDPEQPEPPERC
jgi:hypothetical protein